MKKVVLKTYNITKKYGEQLAVDNVNMTIKKGDIYGFIGKNGAGKTTLIRLITGLIHKSSGEIELLGVNEENELNKARTMVGSLIESPSLYTNMTARENLEVSRLVMRQRLGIANALMGNPKLLILDEPINGLDPMGIVEIRELLKKINKEKDMTILISSHILSELSELATTYGIISNGKLIEEITAKQLSEKCRQYIDLKVDDTARAVILLERELGISDYEVLEDSNMKVFSNLDNVGEVNSLLSRSGIIVESISVKGENLEEYFMNKVGGVLNA